MVVQQQFLSALNSKTAQEHSLKSQGVDRVHVCRLEGRVKAKDDSDHRTDGQSNAYPHVGYIHRRVYEDGNDIAKRNPDDNADHTTNLTEYDSLHEKLSG